MSEGPVRALSQAVEGKLGHDVVVVGDGELGVRPGVVHVDALDDEGHVDLLAEQPDVAGAVQGNPVPDVLDPARAPLALDSVFSQEVGRVYGGVDLEALVTIAGPR